MDSYGGGGSIPEIESAGEIPRITNLAYNLFPNLVVPLDVTGFPFLVFWPIDIRHTRMDIHWISPNYGDGELPGHWPSLLKVFDMVLREDTENLRWIQKSVESPGFLGIPLNYQERRIYHVHEEIDRVIGPENVPVELRLEPLLEPYLEQ